MARYILTNLNTGAILGQKLDSGGMRLFVSIAEAYETLARMEAADGEKVDEPGRTFNSWTLCEVNPVERP
ncbi:MAG TPA: hypothetical protein PKW95_15810 [bacterium]|nr:hypothetical protein [bacterium]